MAPRDPVPHAISTHQRSSSRHHEFGEYTHRRKNDPMEAEDDAESVFYPAFCFKASPTHFAWVKMAASDVHQLKRPDGFGGGFCSLCLLPI